MKLVKNKKRDPRLNVAPKVAANRYYRSNQGSVLAPRDAGRSKENFDQNSRYNPDRKVKLTNAFNFSIIVILLILVMSATTLSSNVQVKSETTTFQYRSTDEYSKKATELLNNNMARRSKLFFRSERYEEEFRAAFPELDSIAAILPLGGRDLTLKIKPDPPIATVAGSSGESLAVTNTGVIARAQTSLQGSDLPTLAFVDGLGSSESGILVLNSSEVELIELSNSEFKNLDLTQAKIEKISRIEFSVARGELTMYFEGVSFYVKLTSYGEVREQVGAVIAALKQLGSEGALPAEYIDGRVSGRVFVK